MFTRIFSLIADKMEDGPLDYLEEDLDLMIDEELEIERELELERSKENRGPSPPVLPRASPRALRPTDTNVGLGDGGGPGDGGEAQGKRQRSQGDEDFPPMEVRSPAVKRFKGWGEEERGVGEVGVVRAVPRVGERKVLRRVPEGDFQAVTAAGGARFYLRTAAAVAALRRVGGEAPATGRPTGLCGAPFHELRRAATAELARMAAAAIQEEVVEEEDDQQTELWVEKFKPRCYTDLLSDNGTNRTLLMWLKLWDQLVFGKERKVKRQLTEEEVEAARWKAGAPLPEVVEEWGADGRPQQRVALLHGPPGLGKTTLAHIVARHAGYKVVEINASDDRSVEAFKKSLESATQMKSVMSDDRRPNCLVIDEIDGAPAATINLLVAALAGTGRQGKKKGGGKGGAILRPVIAICNELYTPALRPLRNMALVLPFPPTL